MGAPTWPPTPEEGYEATMAEYGVTAEQLGLAEDDEEAERALLAHFLFAPPKRQPTDGPIVGLPMRDVHRRLAAWLRMITGGDYQLGNSEPASTDGHHLFLPRAVPAPLEPWGDEVLFRGMALVQAGLGSLGFLEGRPLLAEIHRDWVLRSCYHLLVGRFIVRYWGERYPGIRADFRAVEAMEKAGSMRVNVTEVPREGLPDAFIPLYQGLTINLNWSEPGPRGDPARRAIEALDRARDPREARGLALHQGRVLREHFKRLRLGPPPLPYYFGIIRPEWLLADLSRDLAYEQEWKKGNKPIRQLLGAMARKPNTIPIPALGDEPAATDRRVGLRGRLKQRLKRRGKAAPADLGEMPAYGALRDEFQAERDAPRDVRYGAAKWDKGTRPEDIVTNQIEGKPTDDGGRDHDEWDYKAGAYKLAETRVFTPDAATGPIAGYDKIVAANQKEIKQVRKRFEALRVEERWMGGQYDGAEIDIPRAIDAYVDIIAGHQPREDFYRRFVRRKQEICVMTLVDTSGSTQGRILHAEQEAVILFAEGLRTLGVPHAFYSFHSTHPKECLVSRLKGFDETYGDVVKKRLGNLRPNGATRMGAFIRHAGFMLSTRTQARRVLILLSDGKPEDRGDYRGAYGIKDAAMAVAETRRAGVHVHCISLDPAEDAEEYLAEIFGRGRYLTLKNADSLPARLPEVFRDLVK